MELFVPVIIRRTYITLFLHSTVLHNLDRLLLKNEKQICDKMDRKNDNVTQFSFLSFHFTSFSGTDRRTCIRTYEYEYWRKHKKVTDLFRTKAQMNVRKKSCIQEDMSTERERRLN